MLSDAEAFEKYPGGMMFALIEQEPLSHLVLKRIVGEGIQQIDPPDEIKIVNSSEFSKDRQVMLILSVKELNGAGAASVLFYWTGGLSVALLAGWGICSLCAYVRLKLRKKSLVLLTYVFFVPASPFLEAKNNSVEAVPIICVAPSHDAGTVKVRGGADGRVEHTFMLKNSGTVPLNIVRFDASCSCASAEVSTGVVLSGEDVGVTVRMELTASSFSGRSADVIVVFEDEAKKQFSYMVTLTAKGEYAGYVSPEIVDFGIVSPTDGTSQTRSVYVCLPSLEKDAGFIQSLKSNFPEAVKFKVEWQRRERRVSQDRKEYFFHMAKVNIMMKRPDASFIGKPVVVIDLANGESLPVRLQAVLKESALFMPAEVVFFEDEMQGRAFRQVIYDGSMGGSPLSASVSGKGLSLVRRVRFRPILFIRLPVTERVLFWEMAPWW